MVGLFISRFASRSRSNMIIVHDGGMEVDVQMTADKSLCKVRFQTSSKQTFDDYMTTDRQGRPKHNTPRHHNTSSEEHQWAATKSPQTTFHQ